MLATTTHPAITGGTFAPEYRRALRCSRWLAIALLLSACAHAQEIEKVEPAGKFHTALISKPMGFVREIAATGHDFATFRNPQWSVLTIAQIGASTADAVTTLNNLRNCPSYAELGVSRFFVGAHPDAHKYIIAGVVEIGVEAVAAHYFQNHGPVRKWYWRALWTLPQSFSLYEHAQAARHNAEIGPE
jgi:hypothetical protein